MIVEHSPSRRRAPVLMVLALATAIGTASCSMDAPSVPNSNFHMSISPKVITLNPFQQLRFTASFTSPDGNPVSDRRVKLGLSYSGTGETPPMEWSTTGGIIAEDGRYAAPEVPGEYQVIVYSATGNAADTAHVVVTAGKPVLRQVELVPESAVLEPDQAQQFVAYGRLTTGDSVALDVVYDATGGSIAADGLYTAGSTVGTFRVIATDTSGTFADTSTVIVADVRPSLQSIAIVPATAVLLVGGAQQFSARGAFSNGDTIPVSALYSATGGTIASAGYYTAGATPGEYLVIASDTSQTLADTSLVTIVRPSVAEVRVTPQNASLVVGETEELFATAHDSVGGLLSDRTITWTSSDQGVVSVNGGGQITAHAVGVATITAQSEGVSGNASVTVSAVPVSSVVVTPPSASLGVGESTQLSASARDANGAHLADRSITWTSSNNSVATVTGGFVSGVAPGSATIVATSEGQSGSASITVSGTTPARTGYYVAPHGSSSGDGSSSNPWDLGTALNHPSVVQPGDTIWLLGGTYPLGRARSNLTGSANAPIIVRQYPGQRAVVDGSLGIQGGDTWYWGFELMTTTTSGSLGFDVWGLRIKLINLVVHDAAMSGIGFWSEAVDGELYGSIIYNNGSDEHYDHGIYTANKNGSTKVIENNIIFNNRSYGLHGFSQGSLVSHFTVTNNTMFQNGVISRSRQSLDLFLGGGQSMTGNVVSHNVTYKPISSSTGTAVQFGHTTSNEDITVTNNYFVGGGPLMRIKGFSTARFANNFMYNDEGMVYVTTPTSGWTWEQNVSYRDPSAAAWAINGSAHTFDAWKSANGFAGDVVPATAPTGVKVFVRHNKYDPDLTYITIYNWEGTPTVAVDVSSVLNPDNTFAVYNVQDDPTGIADGSANPVLSGTYQGGSINIPMTGVTPPTPVRGFGAGTPAPTGPTFDAFVLRRIP